MIHGYTIVNAVPFGAMRYLWLYQSFYQRMRRMGNYNMRVEPTVWLT